MCAVRRVLELRGCHSNNNNNSNGKKIMIITSNTNSNNNSDNNNHNSRNNATGDVTPKGGRAETGRLLLLTITIITTI